jgi:hypothetical protein
MVIIVTKLMNISVIIVILLNFVENNHINAKL